MRLMYINKFELRKKIFAGEGEVTVDESLFQDLDDLDLEDDDEDYVPGADEGLSD